MKKISRIAALLVLTASFSAPLLASAVASGGCSSASGSCTINVANDGTCSQSPEGGFYCRPNIFTSQPGGSGSGAINPKYLQDYKTGIIWVINFILLPVLVAVAFITFLWGVYKYFILGADSDTERATGRQFVLWGIIGFVIIFTIWSLVNLVSVTLSLPSGNPPKTPML